MMYRSITCESGASLFKNSRCILSLLFVLIIGQKSFSSIHPLPMKYISDLCESCSSNRMTLRGWVWWMLQRNDRPAPFSQTFNLICHSSAKKCLWSMTLIPRTLWRKSDLSALANEQDQDRAQFVQRSFGLWHRLIGMRWLFLFVKDLQKSRVFISQSLSLPSAYTNSKLSSRKACVTGGYQLYSLWWLDVWRTCVYLRGVGAFRCSQLSTTRNRGAQLGWTIQA